MDAKEKILIRYRLALTIHKIISSNQERNTQPSVTSLRKLAASSETEYAIIQKISSSKKDPQFTTVAAIIDGFGISFSQFAHTFDSITKDDIDVYTRGLKEKSKLPRSSSRKPDTKKVSKGKK